MWPPDFEPCNDLAPADWILPRLLPWGTDGALVTNIIPVGYDAYVRVFHPAGAGPLDDPVTWHEVAAWSGRTVHPLAQFEKMSIPLTPNPGPPPFGSAPWLGSLTPAICNVLVRELAKLTGTPSNCYFAIWDGMSILTAGSSVSVREFAKDDDDDHGDHHDDDVDTLEAQRAAWQRPVAQLPRFEHPYRSYLLGRGPIGVACDLDRHPLAPDSWQTLGLPPQLWWSEDRAWVVASEIDFDTTIVATTKAGADALLTCDGLEALLVPSDGRLDLGGDEINLA